MKKVHIISEAIYKGKHKLVNSGAFVNLSDLMSDIFSCEGITCCNGTKESKSEYYIRKAYITNSLKKPGANWTSLEKIVKDMFNCFTGTSLCPSKASQWWVSSDVIRNVKTVETISFTQVLDKVLKCCDILDSCTPINFQISGDFGIPYMSKAVFESMLTSMGNTSSVSNYSHLNGTIRASVTNLVTLNFSIAFPFLITSMGITDIIKMPTSVTTLNVSDQNMTTLTLDAAAALFLLGTLPKTLWDSTNQVSSDEPSIPTQSVLTINTTSVAF